MTDIEEGLLYFEREDPRSTVFVFQIKPYRIWLHKNNRVTMYTAGEFLFEYTSKQTLVKKDLLTWG